MKLPIKINYMNKTLLDELTNLDCQKILNNMKSSFINIYYNNNINGLILGLSGGIDSTVITYLCSLFNKKKTMIIVMPDTKITPVQETNDAIKTIKKLKLNYKLIDISPIVNEYSLHIDSNEKALGNLRARIRTNLLYYYANLNNLLVVGSTDKSEYMLGYFTKFGDGAADILPIASFYKTQIKILANFLQNY